MTLTQLNKPLLDMGGQAVLWDSDLGTLVQDPTQGGTNAYGPGDLFHDPSNGDVFQLGTDGSLTLVHAGAPPVVPAAAAIQGAAATPPVTSNSTNVSSALTTGFSSSSNNNAVAVQGNVGQWINQAGDWLTKSNKAMIKGLPNGFLVVGGYLLYTQVKQRRRNPGNVTRRRRGLAAHFPRRNPGGGLLKAMQRAEAKYNAGVDARAANLARFAGTVTSAIRGVPRRQVGQIRKLKAERNQAQRSYRESLA